MSDVLVAIHHCAGMRIEQPPPALQLALGDRHCALDSLDGRRGARCRGRVRVTVNSGEQTREHFRLSVSSHGNWNRQDVG